MGGSVDGGCKGLGRWVTGAGYGVQVVVMVVLERERCVRWVVDNKDRRHQTV